MKRCDVCGVKINDNREIAGYAVCSDCLPTLKAAVDKAVQTHRSKRVTEVLFNLRDVATLARIAIGLPGADIIQDSPTRLSIQWDALSLFRVIAEAASNLSSKDITLLAELLENNATYENGVLSIVAE